jgi:carboxypeptidase Taq
MSDAPARLARLRERLAVPSHLLQATALLTWDEATYLPPGGADGRGRQVATLARLAHDHLADGGMVDLVAELEADAESGRLGADDVALVRETRRHLDRDLRVPGDLVAALARQQVRGRGVWARARAAADFATFAPELRAMVALQRERAAALDATVPAYDALHDLYERGSTAAKVARVFGPLRGEISELVREIQASPVRPDATILGREFAEAAQEAFVTATARAMGYDFERGRLDPTTHPFASGIGRGDVRITTRYDAGTCDRRSSRRSTRPDMACTSRTSRRLTPARRSSRPRASPCTSRSRGCGRTSSDAACPSGRVRSRRCSAPSRTSSAASRSRPSTPRSTRSGHRFIRVEADEVTYHLHVMIRFDLERALLDGSLDVGDLPGAWAERYRRDLGIVVPDDRRGCLQDVHWAAGMIGYFPTYTLGTLLSVQLWEAMAKELGDLDALVREGDFAPILAWLVEKVHRHGSRYTCWPGARRAACRSACSGPACRRPPSRRPPQPSACVPSRCSRAWSCSSTGNRAW